MFDITDALRIMKFLEFYSKIFKIQGILITNYMYLSYFCTILCFNSTGHRLKLWQSIILVFYFVHNYIFNEGNLVKGENIVQKRIERNGEGTVNCGSGLYWSR